jgi:hypothetical protein
VQRPAHDSTASPRAIQILAWFRDRYGWDAFLCVHYLAALRRALSGTDQPT